MHSDGITETASHPVAPSQPAETPARYEVEPEEVDLAHVHLPPQSIWPLTAALGVAIGGLGLVTFILISIFGVILMIYAVAMWVQELRHEQPH